jgi:hypothetical protein
MRFNKLCEIEDWQDPAMFATIRRVSPSFTRTIPDYPRGWEHRKHWEYAQLLNGLDELNVIYPDALVLSVAGGHEEPAYDLTNRVRWVFLTDLYGGTDFQTAESQYTVLTDPDRFANCPYNRRRLVVQYMNALDLRFETNTFDAVFSLSSIEHFGGVTGAKTALREMHRVAKAGGAVMITTECIVNDLPDYEQSDLILFSRDSIMELARCSPGLELVSAVDFSISQSSMRTCVPLVEALENARKNRIRYPHVVLEYKGRQYTSIALFFRKTH